MESELNSSTTTPTTRWVVLHVLRAHPFVSPVLLVVGRVLGACLAARRTREFSALNLGANVRQFGFGGVVMGAALFVGGCPTRIIIRSGYGDVAGLLALAGVAVGIVAATLSL